MRDGKKDFKGKFWIGQRVKLDWAGNTGIKKSEFATHTGVITKVHSKFLRTPHLTVITYLVRVDGDRIWKRAIVKNSAEFYFDGEYLEPIK